MPASAVLHDSRFVNEEVRVGTVFVASITSSRDTHVLLVEVMVPLVVELRLACPAEPDGLMGTNEIPCNMRASGRAHTTTGRLTCHGAPRLPGDVDER